MKKLLALLGGVLLSRNAHAVLTDLMCADGTPPPCDTIIVPDYGDIEKLGYDCSQLSTDWTNLGIVNAIVWQKRTYSGYAETSSQCVPNVSYACKAGYYGSPTSSSASSSCTVCPDGRTSTVGENTTIMDCYYAANTSYSDETGTFKYSSDCPVCPDDSYYLCSDGSGNEFCSENECSV